jgi:hypothetical protein
VGCGVAVTSTATLTAGGTVLMGAVFSRVKIWKMPKAITAPTTVATGK